MKGVAGVVDEDPLRCQCDRRLKVPRAAYAGNIEPLEERTVAGAVEAIDVQDCAPDRHDRFCQQRGERGLAVGDKGGGRRLPDGRDDVRDALTRGGPVVGFEVRDVGRGLFIERREDDRPDAEPRPCQRVRHRGIR